MQLTVGQTVGETLILHIFAEFLLQTKSLAHLHFKARIQYNHFYELFQLTTIGTILNAMQTEVSLHDYIR